MEVKYVKDIMVPLNEYAVVGIDDTVFDALMELKESQKHIGPGRFLHRAVLVKNESGKIVGKIGHLSFLKALEPKYDRIGNLDLMSRSGLSPEFISTLALKMDLFQDDITKSCKRLKTIKVSEIMHQVNEHIDMKASLIEAIHCIVMWQTLSVLVTDGNKVVGILRLSDLFQEVFGEIVGGCH